MRVLIVFFMLSNVLRAESDQEVRAAIMQEMHAIVSFSNEQVNALHEEIQEFSNDDMWRETLMADNDHYRSISLEAQKNLEQMEKGLSMGWAKIYLQLLRNNIYALHSDKEELLNAGIKRRSRSLLASGIDFASTSSTFLIKCAGTLVALKTIYEITPAIWSYFMSDMCSAS